MPPDRAPGQHGSSSGPAPKTNGRRRSHRDLSRSTSPTGLGANRTPSSRSSRNQSRNHSPSLGRGRSGRKVAWADDVGARPVVTGPVYVRSQGQWRLGTLTVARDSLRFTSSGAAPLGFVELLLGCADVARGRVLCSAEADHDPGVFEVEVLPSVRGATATAVRELSVRASRDGRGECVWFKVGDMARATEWAEAVDDASQAAGDAAAGLIWDWFRVPGPGAGPAVLAFSSTVDLAVPTLLPSVLTGLSISSASRRPTRDDDALALTSITRVLSSDTLDGDASEPPPQGGVAAHRRTPAMLRTLSSATSDDDRFVRHPQLHHGTLGTGAGAAADAPFELTLPLAMDLVNKYAAIARRRRDEQADC